MESLFKEGGHAEGGAFFTALFLSAWIATAQQTANYTDPFKKADADLTCAYKQTLTRFAPQNQEILRRAERAWITFSDKYKAVLNALRRQNLLTDDAVNTATLAEVDARTNHLTVFFLNPQVPTAQKNIYQNTDQRLGNIYTECMRRLSSGDQHLLKEAERAWITYRDTDSVSVMVAQNKQTVQLAAACHLTDIRVAQLTSLVNAMGTAPNTPLPVQEPQKVATPTTDDLKAVSQFQDDAKGMLKVLLAEKEEPFFKNGDALKNVPSLPSDMEDRLSKLDSMCAELSHKSYSQQILQPSLNEYAAVKLLAGWRNFIQQLKNGSVEAAGTILHTALSLKPKDVTPDYLPLWQSVQNWEDVYAKNAPKFKDHIQKAKSFADLGKISDATKEYQAAYDIIENSSIPAQVRKLREQSLGL